MCLPSIYSKIRISDARECLPKSGKHLPAAVWVGYCESDAIRCFPGFKKHPLVEERTPRKPQSEIHLKDESANPLVSKILILDRILNPKSKVSETPMVAPSLHQEELRCLCIGLLNFEKQVTDDRN